MSVYLLAAYISLFVLCGSYARPEADVRSLEYMRKWWRDGKFTEWIPAA
jgi:hypothetical protein